MGVKMNCRINIMRQINTKLCVDNYKQTDCIKVLELKNISDTKQNLTNKIFLAK